MGLFCLPKGRLSEAAHEKRLLCAQNVPGVGCVMEGGLSWRHGVGHIQSNLVIEANHHYLHTIPPGNYSKLLREQKFNSTTL